MSGADPKPAVEVPPQLVITFNGAGVQVTGPINNKMLCYGMLEMAKEAIAAHNTAKAGPGLMIAQGLPR